MRAICFLLVSWLAITNAATCKTKVTQNVFLRCCRLDKYFTTSTIDECLNKCNEFNSNRKPNENACSRVNWGKSSKECSLLYMPDNYANDPTIGSEHSDFVSGQLIDCSGGGPPATPAPAPTPAPRPPSRPTKGVGCGRQAPQYQPSLPGKTRIIGGQTAKPHSWPWQVALPGCGGSLLRVHDDIEETDIVLTAAHCVPTDGKGGLKDFSWMSVLAGAQLVYNDNSAGSQERKVVDIQYHKDYKNLVNDIAILKLESPIRFSDTIRPICLPREGEGAPTNRVCVGTGWGRNESHTENSPQELQQSVLPVHTIEWCQSTWYWEKPAWSYAFLCAGNANTATCNGDSGGPLVCKYEDGSWVQHGVVSYGTPAGTCTSNHEPPVLARVSTYAGWIRDKINRMSSLLNG